MVLKQPGSNSLAVLRMRAEIDKDRETWADAEIALVKLPFSNYGEDVRRVVMACFMILVAICRDM